MTQPCSLTLAFRCGETGWLPLGTISLRGTLLTQGKEEDACRRKIDRKDGLFFKLIDYKYAKIDDHCFLGQIGRHPSSSLFVRRIQRRFVLSYVQDNLVPTLHNHDIVIMDHLRCHKVDGVKDAIEKAGAHLLYLPPYSPDFNPIEMLWSKLKSILRKWKTVPLRPCLPLYQMRLHLFPSMTF